MKEGTPSPERWCLQVGQGAPHHQGHCQFPRHPPGDLERLHPPSLMSLQRFSLSPLEEAAALCFICHLYFCGGRDGGVGVARGGVVCVQLSISGVERLVLGVELSFVAMWWLGGHVRVDGADGCRLRERMSGQDGAAGVAAAPGQFLTRTLAPAAPHCGEVGPSHRSSHPHPTA